MRATVLTILLAGGASASTLVGTDVTLITRDGQRHAGHVLAETSSGYLVRGETATEVVEFAQIADVATTAATVSATPAQVVSARHDWIEDRRGFHVGLGFGAMAYPWVIDFHQNTDGWFGAWSLNVPCSFDLGRIELRATPMLGMTTLYRPSSYDRSTTYGVMFALDGQMRVHATRLFSFGIGVFQAAFSGGGLVYALGPSLTPFAFRWGTAGQHEVSGWVTLPFVPANSMVAAAPVGQLAYAYFW